MTTLLGKFINKKNEEGQGKDDAGAGQADDKDLGKKLKAVNVEGEKHLARHHIKDVGPIANILAKAMPADFLSDTELEINASKSEIEFELNYDSDPRKEVELKFDIRDKGTDLHIGFAVLGPDLQGKGVMKDLMKGILEIAALAPNLEQLSLLANIDVGGYAWARYGFEPDDPTKVVGEIKGRIQEVLQKKTTKFDELERTVELPAEMEQQLKDLHGVDDKDPRTAFQLLAGANTKIKIPGQPLDLGVERLPGGNKIRGFTDQITGFEADIQEGDDEAQGKIDQLLKDIESGKGELLASFRGFKVGSVVPGTKYDLNANGLGAIQAAIDNLQDPDLNDTTLALDSIRLNHMELEKRLRKLRFSVDAPPEELTVAQVLMLGLSWDGHINLKPNDPDGLNRLKKYLGMK